MFSWFERRLDPFPPQEPTEPPATLTGFCLHYTRGAWPWLAVSALLMAVAAVVADRAALSAFQDGMPAFLEARHFGELRQQHRAAPLGAPRCVRLGESPGKRRCRGSCDISPAPLP